jgi:hypothetical protein
VEVIHQLRSILFAVHSRGCDQPFEFRWSKEFSLRRRRLLEKFDSRQVAQITIINRGVQHVAQNDDI